MLPKKSYDVSVIVALYKPDRVKLKRTLNSILVQKNIAFEVLITDDGSERDFFSEIDSYFNEHDFIDYKKIKNTSNVGTVKNYLGAVRESGGKYVFLTSPGDFLYDENALKNFFDYSEQNNAKVVFGSAYWYSAADQNSPVEIFNNRAPAGKTHRPKLRSREFIFGDYILGAAYFRETESFKECLSRVAEKCKYTEDTTSTLEAIYKGIQIYYCEKPLTWYEFGTGITAKTDNTWGQIINAEIASIYERLIRETGDKTLKDAYRLICLSNSRDRSAFAKKLLILMKYPLVMTAKVKAKLLLRFQRNKISDADREKLEKILYS